MINEKDSLGIPSYGMHYLKMPAERDSLRETLAEFLGIHGFINQVASSNTVPEFQGKQKRLQFINYGSTQLVFVFTIDEKRQYTFLVNQPSAPFGIGKREFDNLRRLSKDNKDNVISPLYYFTDSNNERRELYITPYHYQSRCVGVEDKEWGVWVPEPEYLFHDFKPRDRAVINASMVALLVQFYDAKNKKGLSEIRLDGGDFMLEKGFEDYDINFDNILKRMKLIAARNLVTMEFDEYIDKLRQELSEKTENLQGRQIIGKKLRKPLDSEEVEAGIKLGLSLREKEKSKQLLK